MRKDAMTQSEILANLQDKLTLSHSPYSGVQVAAAVEYILNGETHIAYGVNVENVSYGLTVCAERSAISCAIMDGMKNISALYVISNQSEAISPCGACRQVVSEFIENEAAPVLCFDHSLQKKWESTLGELLPNRFTLE